MQRCVMEPEQSSHLKVAEHQFFFKGKGLSGSIVRIEFQPEKGKITEEKRQTNVVLFMFN